MEETRKVGPGIVINPHVNSGRASIDGRWTPVWVLASRFAAGDSIRFLADDFEITEEQVCDALRYEISSRSIVT